MSTLKHDIIEIWYFDSEADLKTKNKTKAVGHSKTVDGILKELDGRITPHQMMESDTEVEDD